MSSIQAQPAALLLHGNKSCNKLRESDGTLTRSVARIRQPLLAISFRSFQSMASVNSHATFLHFGESLRDRCCSEKCSLVLQYNFVKILNERQS
jgi:hypothetical protein